MKNRLYTLLCIVVVIAGGAAQGMSRADLANKMVELDLVQHVYFCYNTCQNYYLFTSIIDDQEAFRAELQPHNVGYGFKLKKYDASTKKYELIDDEYMCFEGDCAEENAYISKALLGAMVADKSVEEVVLRYIAIVQELCEQQKLLISQISVELLADTLNQYSAGTFNTPKYERKQEIRTIFRHDFDLCTFLFDYQDNDYAYYRNKWDNQEYSQLRVSKTANNVIEQQLTAASYWVQNDRITEFTGTNPAEVEVRVYVTNCITQVFSGGDAPDQAAVRAFFDKANNESAMNAYIAIMKQVRESAQRSGVAISTAMIERAQKDYVAGLLGGSQAHALSSFLPESLTHVIAQHPGKLFIAAAGVAVLACYYAAKTYCSDLQEDDDDDNENEQTNGKVSYE